MQDHVPWPGIEPWGPCIREPRVLATGPAGKSLSQTVTTALWESLHARACGDETEKPTNSLLSHYRWCIAAGSATFRNYPKNLQVSQSSQFHLKAFWWCSDASPLGVSACCVLWDTHPFFLLWNVEAETPILWPPDVESWLIWKDPDVWKHWGQEEKGITEVASPTQWTWVWVDSRSWWWTRRPGMLQVMGSQTVGYDLVTELKLLLHPLFPWQQHPLQFMELFSVWTAYITTFPVFKFLPILFTLSFFF